MKVRLLGGRRDGYECEVPSKKDPGVLFVLEHYERCDCPVMYAQDRNEPWPYEDQVSRYFRAWKAPDGVKLYILEEVYSKL